jgi:hypothetical protein
MSSHSSHQKRCKAGSCKNGRIDYQHQRNYPEGYQVSVSNRQNTPEEVAHQVGRITRGQIDEDDPHCHTQRPEYPDGAVLTHLARADMYSIPNADPTPKIAAPSTGLMPR